MFRDWKPPATDVSRRLLKTRWPDSRSRGLLIVDAAPTRAPGTTELARTRHRGLDRVGWTFTLTGPYPASIGPPARMASSAP